MAIPMPIVQDIRRLDRQGMSRAQIARRLHVDRGTVAKYADMEDCSPKPKADRRYGSKIDPYAHLVDGWLEADRMLPRKQRHTIRRVHDRLLAETDYDGEYSTTMRYVHRWREANRGVPDREGYVRLEWAAGSMQVDFGVARARIAGEMADVHFLVVSFPYSNMRYVAALPGETAECVCHGLNKVFSHAGMVPRVLVFDNATGVGHRRADGTVTQTRLFSLFCAHYGFETRFCNPYSGWEKGSTENAVGFLRRNLMVPTPSAEGWDRLTDAWLERCDEIARGVHYREDVPIRDLFETDLDHMLPLPPSMFDACDWRGVKADRTGTVTIDSNRYLAGPKWHSMRLMAGVRALRVELRSMDGEPIVTLERRWGRSPDTAMDPLSLLAIIARKPRSWGESPIRSDFPEETRVLLDRMEPRERGLLVDDIRHAAVVSGFRAAVMAVVEIVAAGRRPDRAAIDQTARRIAQGDGPESRARLDTYSRFMREDGDE